MSSARDLNMAKIEANVAELEEESQEEIDASQPEIANKKELSTQRQIARLEKALEIAKSQVVKSKLREEIEQAKIRKAEEDKRKQEELETYQRLKESSQIAGNIVSGVTGTTANIGSKAKDLADSTTSTLATVSTPGSIFLPIALLLLFFFLIIPVNGKTRAQWLWMALFGQARIGQQNAENPTNSSGSGDIAEQPTKEVSTFPAWYRSSTNYNNQYIKRQS